MPFWVLFGPLKKPISRVLGGGHTKQYIFRRLFRPSARTGWEEALEFKGYRKHFSQKLFYPGPFLIKKVHFLYREMHDFDPPTSKIAHFSRAPFESVTFVYTSTHFLCVFDGLKKTHSHTQTHTRYSHLTHHTHTHSYTLE